MPDARRRARAKLDRILAEHEPEPLEDAQQAELTRILQVAQRESGERDQFARLVSRDQRPVSTYSFREVE